MRPYLLSLFRQPLCITTQKRTGNKRGRPYFQLILVSLYTVCLVAICQRSLYIYVINRTESSSTGGKGKQRTPSLPQAVGTMTSRRLTLRQGRLFFGGLQKGGVPAAPSGTATLLRLSPNHQFHPRPPLAVADFRCPRLSWLDGRCVQGPGTYSPRHG